MAYKINQECIRCGSCVAECKNNAITRGETYYGDTIYIIDPDKCTECVGWFKVAMCAGVCPVYSCLPDANHKETRQELLDKWQKLHPGMTPVVT